MKIYLSVLAVVFLAGDELPAAPVITVTASSYENDGDLHQTTCPNTSHQNGVVECKHRHILDVTHTLMLQMYVPKYLWSDIVLTAAYLINKMLSAPFGGEVPLQHLQPEKELFSLPPRVFGCVAFVQDLSLGLDKLFLRSIKCVFVGYSRIQRGYRCFHPRNHCYIVSANVTFFESTPYFDSIDSVPLPLDSVPLSPTVMDSTTDDNSSPVVEQNVPRLL